MAKLPSYLVGKEKQEYDLKRYYKVIDRVTNKGDSLEKALKSQHMESKTFWKINEEREHYAGYAKAYTSKKGEKVVHSGRGLSTNYDARWLIPSIQNGMMEEKYIRVDRKNASIMGSYWNAIKQAQDTGDTSALSKFKGVRVVTLDGKVVELPTSMNTIGLYDATMSEDFRSELDRKLYQLLKGSSSKGASV